jgi:hypothetical protein
MTTGGSDLGHGPPPSASTWLGRSDRGNLWRMKTEATLAILKSDLDWIETKIRECDEQIQKYQALKNCNAVLLVPVWNSRIQSVIDVRDKHMLAMGDIVKVIARLEDLADCL